MRDFSLQPRRAGYTLAELMVAVGIFAIGSAIVYPVFIADFGLYARNFSINKSNNSLRASLQQLKRDVDMAVQPPTLATFTMTNGVGSLLPLPDNAVSAQAMFMWVSLGPAYDMPAPSTSAANITPTGSITLKRHVLNGDALQSPAPMKGDRLVFLTPAPYNAGMPEKFNYSTYPGFLKPGRAITGVSIADPADSGRDTFTVTIDQTNPFPSTVNILGNESVLIVREVAYAANTIYDASGKPVERQLIYYPSTYNMSKGNVLVRDLDPQPQEIDAATGQPVQPFNYYGGKGNLTPLNVILPIRAVDYASVIGDRNLGSATTGTSSSEFNAYLRSSSQLGIKVRLVN